MAELQTTYSDTIAAGYPGMIANGENGNRISRSCETAAGIGFGKAVYRGAGDHGCLLAQTLVGAGSEAASGNVGTSTITDVPTVAAGAKIGRYIIKQLTTSATGELAIFDPYGVHVGSGVVGTEFVVDGITATVTSGGTATAGDTFYVDVTGNDFLGISIATSSLGLVAGADADEYQRYDTVAILTGGTPIWVTAGGSVTDGAPVFVDSSGDFVASSGVPLVGWVFDTTGADDALVKIVKR
jgi:hypothetical protein